MTRNLSLTADYGGHINPDKPWEKALLWHMGASTSCSSTSGKLRGCQEGLFRQNNSSCTNAPLDPRPLITNLNETGLKLTLVSNHTL